MNATAGRPVPIARSDQRSCPHVRAPATRAGDRYWVYGSDGRLGFLRSVLSIPRLLMLDAPQEPDGILLIPFEAIDWIDVHERRILLLPARDALELAAQRSPTARGGD